MQSSPPQRASNGPPSPVRSEYSINLDALEFDSRSGASTPLPIQQVDRVFSEDIDGPSDFTINMEKWMRGGSLRRGGLPSLNERNDEDEGLLPTTEKENQRLPEDERTASHHTPSNSPPKESPFAHPLMVVEDKDDDQGSSDWEPFAEAQTPMPQKMGEQRQFLQPTVEEYHSELTPVRPPTARTTKMAMDRNAMDEEHSLSKSELPQPESRASSPLVSPERSPVTQRNEMDRTDYNRSLEQQLESLHLKCDELQTLNATLNETINEERRRRKEDSAAHEAQVADFARRERDLTGMKDQSQQHREDFRREFSEMKERVRSYEKQHESHRQGTERLRRKHDSEIQELKAQLDRERHEYKDELRALEQDVELARRSREDAEETARASQEQMDERVAEVDRLKMEIQQGEELREGIKEQLRNAKMENERLEGTKRSAENAMKDVETLSLAKDIEIERLKTEEAQVVDELRKELEEVKAQLSDAQAKAREQDANSTSAIQKELDDLRTSYNYAIIGRDELQDELTTIHGNLAVERAARVADKEEAETVNANLHARISAGIRTREGYWRGRVKDMEDERRVMVKALLRGWGREEMGFGVDDGREDGKGMTESGWQLYEYLFAVARAYEKEGKGERRVEFADL